jgi:UDPglucose 6-dehydrogenase
MARLAVVGTGYVGLVTGSCLADLGHHVTCVDVHEPRIRDLQAGRVPIHEPGLDAVVARGAAADRLHFTTDLPRALEGAAVAFVAVGTPSRPDGSADLRFVESAVDSLAKGLGQDAVVVLRSTVPPGTGDAMQARLQAAGRPDLHVVNAPEFLAEGTAVKDFQNPERVVAGGPRAAQVLALFDGLNPQAPRIATTRTTAELAKYAANTFLAARVSLVNELAAVCDDVGADVRDLARIVGLDSRIGGKFLRPGIGYGGSCFPKDVSALAAESRRLGLTLDVVPAVEAANRRQRQRADAKLRLLLPDLKGRRIAVWGIAFKPGTDDVRDAPGLALMRTWIDAGATVVAHDPQARLPADLNGATQAATALDAVRGADALVLATEWPEYAHVDADAVGNAMAHRNLLDGRNHLDHAAYRKAGFRVHAIGVPQ